MNDIPLAGCTPTPLASYLKALGVLRLLSSKDRGIRGFWRGNMFILRSSLSPEDVENFFLYKYEPTPIIAPWNAGSGFYYRERKSTEKDPATGKKKKLGIYDQETAATKILDKVLSTESERFGAYRKAISCAKLSVKTWGLVTAPESGRSKDDFIQSLRSLLADECITALDAGIAIAGGESHFPPMLGSGWNDGNLDFTSNFMQRLLDVLGSNAANLPPQSKSWLQSSLLAINAPNLTKSNIGQFSPGQAGGPNASTGFDANAGINPWDFVLMIEGALCFAAAAVRRHADDTGAVMSYPFTVRSVDAGSGSVGEGDATSARGELWMPLWPQPATYNEIRALMAEGRVALGRRPARDALDFVRAVHHLGSYRGIQSFQRFGLLMRSGRAYLAMPLSRVDVGNGAPSRWLDELDHDQWLDRFRRSARGDTTANRFRVLRKRLEDRLFALSGRTPTRAEAQALLVLLGEIQMALSQSDKMRDDVRPVPRLSEQWVMAVDDGSPAFRIAKALAGLRGVGEQPLPLRSQLFPVQRKFNGWVTPESNGGVRVCSGSEGSLTDTLYRLLARRLWLTEKLGMGDKPLDSAAGATLADIALFLRDDGMDGRIAELLPGLVLCSIPEDAEKQAGNAAVPAAFGLLKLALASDRILQKLGWLPSDAVIPVPAGMLAQLAAGNHDNRAILTAWRRLRSSGLTPIFNADALPSRDSVDPRRAAAALLIPLRYGATAALARNLLNAPESETVTA